MKKLMTVILMLVFANILFAQAQKDTLIDCAQAAYKKGKLVYLKSFQTKLDASNSYHKWPLMLNSGVKYRFFLCENAKDKPENSELILFDKSHSQEEPYASTKKKGSFYFECNKTGTYYVLIHYKKNLVKKKILNATAVLFFVKKKQIK